MKKIIVLLFLASIFSLNISCTSQRDKTTKLITGIWQELNPDYGEFIIEFTTDGSYLQKGVKKGTWELAESKVGDKEHFYLMLHSNSYGTESSDSWEVTNVDDKHLDLLHYSKERKFIKR